jgi:antitoxin YefM
LSRPFTKRPGRLPGGNQLGFSRSLCRWSGPTRAARRARELTTRPLRASPLSAIILYMTSYLPLAEVRDRLSPLVASVQATHERVVITKNGKPAAVLIAVEDLESLEETLDVLSDEEAMQAVREAQVGTKTYDLTEVRDSLRGRSTAA